MDLRSVSAAFHQSPPTSEATFRVSRELLGEGNEDLAFPHLADVASGLIALARGRRRKVLLPLCEGPFELALARCGSDLLASYYSTESMPEVAVLNRRVRLESALNLIVGALRASCARSTHAPIAEKLATLAASTPVEAIPATTVTERSGGSLDAPPTDTPLGFGFRASFRPSETLEAAPGQLVSDRADVHAMLFEGTLWAFARGRRIALASGPILLPVQKMVAAIGAVLEAWEADRGANVRLRSGGFAIALRLSKGSEADSGEASITLTTEQDTVTVTALDICQAAFPILGLASELLRSLSGADRTQSRNLRVRTLRDEVRRLRRLLRDRQRGDGFTNLDPDRLRLAEAPANPSATVAAAHPPVGRLRFAERWRVEVDELDAGATFLCGDRLVISTPRQAVAICRDRGSAYWVREGLGGASWMTGTTLLRQSGEGRIELCHIGDGEPFAATTLAPTIGRPARAVHVGGTGLAPAAVVTEGNHRLVAIDLRTGQPRWRFAGNGAPVEIRRAGRVLLVVSADGSINALDVTTGEVVWRFCDRSRFYLAPAVADETVVAASGDRSARHTRVVGIDLYSGELKWCQRFEHAVNTAPIPLGNRIGITTRGPRQGRLLALSTAEGHVDWDVPDQGLTRGAAAMPIDRSLVVNAPGGQVTCIDISDGSTRWASQLADPLADEVPRCLEPILRGGALFVPASSVHVLRPSDGRPIGGPLPGDLIPDLVRIDERGWIYVAEESGHVAAFAPVAHLSLVR